MINGYRYCCYCLLTHERVAVDAKGYGPKGPGTTHPRSSYGSCWTSFHMLLTYRIDIAVGMLVDICTVK